MYSSASALALRTAVCERHFVPRSRLLPGIAALFAGLISVCQVNNAVREFAERRQFYLGTAGNLDKELEPVRKEMWANLPPNYQWLKNWEWV